ncbi:MAG: isopeptide-forming domain-containing fimbrial protein [Eubacteriales bacterium]|nr:isopeptide-forming domain-containing fimbrial protein [Eubacteriales bacterium]
MKKVSKILSLLLTLALVLGMAVTAFADSTVTTGSITINNAVAGQNYTVYRIFDLSHDDTFEAITYTVNPAWEAFFADPATAAAPGRNYVDIDAQGYVTWKENADAAEFAKKAQVYAATLSNNQGQVTAAGTTVEFKGLEFGYYLVDSSLGVLCALDTTMPDVTMQEKNGVPTDYKEVQEDATQAFGKVNDADIGDTVNFRSTIITQPGAEDYVFHDKMSAGLTLNYGSAADISVTLNGDAVAAGAYTIRTGREVTDGCTFEIVFSQAFCDMLEENGELAIGYSATVNENAVIAGAGNPNESRLTYGEDGQFDTTPSITKTYTWGMDVLKYANGNREKPLEGVKFVLLNSGKSKAAQVANGKLTGWVDVPAQGAPWPAGTELITDAKGEIVIDGLDADTYYLRETAGLPGYNKLADDQEITITATPDEKDNTLTFSRPTAYINNQSGAELPSTGGVGTTYFYALGGVLAVGAAVLLVTKKRAEQA